MRTRLKPTNIKRFALQSLIIIVLIGVDQLIKFFIEKNLRPIGFREFIPHILNLRYLQNTGAAFGSLSSNTNILSAVTSLLILGLIAFLLFEKSNNKIYHFIIPAIIAGGIGNLIDRVSRGFVIDFLEFDFVDFAIFNFADILVTCGGFALAGYLFVTIFTDAKKEKAAKTEVKKANEEA